MLVLRVISGPDAGDVASVPACSISMRNASVRPPRSGTSQMDERNRRPKSIATRLRP